MLIKLEKVEKLKYLGVTLSTKNDWTSEIGIRLNKYKITYYVLIKYFQSKLISIKTKEIPCVVK